MTENLLYFTSPIVTLNLSFSRRRTLSALRHPDGASNPNLKGLGEREKEGEGEKENLTPRSKEEDSDEDPAVPPPLHSTLLTLTRDTLVDKRAIAQTSGQ